ncbi:hypothetical protein NMS23_003584 [Vibrio parahaemolyticus]|nr:hypothetical protein [Vibrio parahaemolyticus]
MDYQLAKIYPKDILDSMGISEIVEVPIAPEIDSKKLSCYNNVRQYLKKHDGKIQFGWTFSQLGNIAYKCNAHVVVRRSSGDYLCVTPSEHKVSIINFTPDDNIPNLIINERLPSVVYPLVDDKVVQKYVNLENLASKMRLEGNIIALQYINNQKYLLSQRLIEAYKKYGEP